MAIDIENDRNMFVLKQYRTHSCAVSLNIGMTVIIYSTLYRNLVDVDDPHKRINTNV